MKIPQSITKPILVAALLIINGVFFCSANNISKTIDPPKSILISFKIKLKSAQKIKIETAPLKYNKHLAYSFTLDDGYRSAYLTAFPLLNGGKISAPAISEWKNNQGGDGTISKGLFYSDGLGNKIPFKLALAINGGAIGDAPQNRGHLSCGLR